MNGMWIAKLTILVQAEVNWAMAKSSVAFLFQITHKIYTRVDK